MASEERRHSHPPGSLEQNQRLRPFRRIVVYHQDRFSSIQVVSSWSHIQAILRIFIHFGPLLRFHWIPHGHYLIYAMGSMCGSRIAEKGHRNVRYGTSSFSLVSKTLKLTDTLGLRKLHSGSLSVESPESRVLQVITCTSALMSGDLPFHI
jgi:hypothetical protein